jgi:hypothetical protein
MTILQDLLLISGSECILQGVPVQHLNILGMTGDRIEALITQN